MRKSLVIAGAALLGGGCSIVSGLDDFSLRQGEGGSAGATSATGGTGGEGGVGGPGGMGGSGAMGGGGSGGAEMSDQGLVFRYPLDEASTGMSPTMVLDVAGNPFHLPIDYGATGNLGYTEVGGHRGLAWMNVGSDATAGEVVGRKLLELDGVTTFTIEVVFDIAGSKFDCPRLMNIARTDTTNFIGHLALCFDLDTVEVRYNERRVLDSPIDVTRAGRSVGHAVIDTTAANPDDRVRYVHDGTQVFNEGGANITMGEGLDIIGSDELTLGNRFTLDRSIEGTLFYVALYDVAFDAERIAQHAAVLLANDD